MVQVRKALRCVKTAFSLRRVMAEINHHQQETRNEQLHSHFSLENSISIRGWLTHRTEDVLLWLGSWTVATQCVLMIFCSGGLLLYAVSQACYQRLSWYCSCCNTMHITLACGKKKNKAWQACRALLRLVSRDWKIAAHGRGSVISQFWSSAVLFSPAFVHQSLFTILDWL